MRKIVSLLLCLTFVFSLVSCASVEEIVPEYTSEVSGEIDLGGKVFKMGTVIPKIGETRWYFPSREMTDSCLNFSCRS